jgi:hypothetical protein
MRRSRRIQENPVVIPREKARIWPAPKPRAKREGERDRHGRVMQFPCEFLYQIVMSGKIMTPPSILDDATMQENYRFRTGELEERRSLPADMVESVLLGKRPVGSFLMFKRKRYCVSRNVLTRVVTTLRLRLRVVQDDQKATRAFVYQPMARLSDYYDVDAVIARFCAAGFKLTREPFDRYIEDFMIKIGDKDFWSDTNPVILGFLHGYPVDVTLSMCLDRK